MVRGDPGRQGDAAEPAPTASLADPAGGGPAREGELGRVLTVPNLLSVTRLGFLAAFAVLVLSDHEDLAAGWMLALAGVTDFLDGYVARRFGQVTTLGKILDPTVDRLVLGTAVGVIVFVGAVPVWLASVVLGREALVGLLALVLAGLGARRIEVTFLGKAGTFGLMVCFPLFLGARAGGSWSTALETLAWVGVVPALACSLVAAVGYVPRARAALAEGRRARAGKVGTF